MIESQPKSPPTEALQTEAQQSNGEVTRLGVIKARTFALLRLFDNSKDMVRKASVLSFLGDSRLLEELQSPSFNLEGSHWGGSNLRRTNLSKARLRKADFSNANLSKTNLSEAKLRKANLSGANLSGSNLSGAELTEADLSSTNLYKANFSEADLSNANLSNANLSNADLHEAILLATDLRTSKSLTKDHLEGDRTPLICNVALPQDMNAVVDSNRDCDCLPQILVNRYPQHFASLEEAEIVVNEAKQKKWN